MFSFKSKKYLIKPSKCRLTYKQILVTFSRGKQVNTPTVNVDIFTQYIFSCISRRALDARKFDVSKNYYQNRKNRINWYVRENLVARICLLVLNTQKISCAKICTFTVYKTLSMYVCEIPMSTAPPLITPLPRGGVGEIHVSVGLYGFQSSDNGGF